MDRQKILKDKANKLPLYPGVYLMKNKAGNIIYVGKAKALKNRVTQYFGSHSNHSAKVIKMVENVYDFETIICDTEYEALMLENALIKQHQPKYNILLKDDKGYHYIKITNDDWPKIEAVKNKLFDDAEYIGPYYSWYVVRNTVDEALKIFKLPNCNRSFDKPTKPCLNFHIGICSAPCKGNVSRSDYLETIKSARSFISDGGINDSDIEILKTKMTIASENLEFELAARLRDRISAFEKFREKQKIIISNYPRQDVISTVFSGELSCIFILIFKNGQLSDKKMFYIDGYKTKSDCYSEFLQIYYESIEDIPPYIAIDSEFEESELISRWLTEKRGSSVKIFVPQKGLEKQLLQMCTSNAAQALSDRLERNLRETADLNELAELLGLKTVPRRIESYDISNTAGSENVGSMVVFINGRPVKSLYRKFKIKSFTGQDDFRSLNEILVRRFEEYKRGVDESFKELPDLILLDGGKGQLSAVRPIIEMFGLSIPLFGMVKDSKHKTRAITAGGDDIQIKSNRKAFTLVNTIQNEVHRVAISYHRQRSKNSSLQLELLNISGVGPETAKKLIRSFRSVKRIKEASVDELISAGISKKTASNILDFYKK
jgi:excinuclease ABC subunit C